jgi:uncharacterized protein DUF4190
MKYCPQCHRQYSEVWLTFCTDDGSLLRDDLTPPADPNWDPRIRETKFDDPSERATQWLPNQDRSAPGGWVAPDERAPMANRPWQPQPPPAPVRINPNAQPHPMAIASLICGIIAVVFGLVCSFPVPGLLAVIFGFVATSQLRRTPGRPGKGMAIAGIIMGAINLVFFLFWILWLAFALAFG